MVLAHLMTDAAETVAANAAAEPDRLATIFKHMEIINSTVEGIKIYCF